MNENETNTTDDAALRTIGKDKWHIDENSEFDQISVKVEHLLGTPDTAKFTLSASLGGKTTFIVTEEIDEEKTLKRMMKMASDEMRDTHLYLFGYLNEDGIFGPMELD